MNNQCTIKSEAKKTAHKKYEPANLTTNNYTNIKTPQSSTGN
jgi:hypothetical protein